MNDDFSLFKEELKQRIDIYDIVSEYVDLKKRGTNYIGLCPFHSEKTPSFNVNRSGQFYHCFGCGKGGDAIGFLMDVSGMSFMEAIEQLADRTGMQVPEKHPRNTGEQAQSERIATANMLAAEYFFHTLLSEEGADALEYFHSRGLSDETIKAFRLGFAPVDTAGLVNFARSRGLDVKALEDAGILMHSRYGGPPKGRFGGRAIFPIIDQTVRVIGFGARLLEGDGAKYLNSPESAVYHKSRVLFGLHQAKAVIKKTRAALVVEGYMDVISLHQAGITNAIAASGTSFTTDQGRIISRLAREATLLFDGDKAGINAAIRGADNLLETDLAIKVAVLPGGHDPDSFVRESGPEALREHIAGAKDIWQFKIDILSQSRESIEERIKHAGEIAESISRISDDIKRDMYIVKMADHVGVDQSTMRKAVYGRIRRRSRRADTPAVEETPIHRDELELLASVIAFPDRARHALEESGPGLFTYPTAKIIAQEILHRLVEGYDVTPSGLIGAIADKNAQKLIASASMLQLSSEMATNHIETHLQRSRIRELRKEIADLSHKRQMETDSEFIARQKRLRDLNQKLKALL